MPPSFTFLAVGDWGPGQVRLSRARGSSRAIVSEVERIIEDTWTRATSRPGVQLFDGPMCRLELFEAAPAKLVLDVSPTSYKPFVGTNLYNAHLAETYGRDVFANPVGVSTLLETADGFLMLGRRNASVAYYPERVHPFAGTIDPDDGDDPFTAAHRELAEELALSADDLADLRCVGLVEDAALLQPELIFVARAKLSREQVDRRVDPAEHHATWSIAGSPAEIDAAVRDPLLTPVAVASLVLWGRSRRASPPAK